MAKGKVVGRVHYVSEGEQVIREERDGSITIGSDRIEKAQGPATIKDFNRALKEYERINKR